MSDIVTLTLELNEKLSGGIQKAGVTTHSVFEGIGKDISNAQRGLDDLGNERRIRVDHSSVREAHEAVEGLGEAMRGLSEMQLIGGMAVGELVARGVERTAEFAKDQIKDVLKGGMEEGSLQLQMKVLAGDDAGKELYEQIHNYIPKSLFGPELNHEAVVLLGMNETVSNILPDLKEFGDISMGDGQKMQSLILALGEAKAQGHLSGLEMRILRTTGFNPLVETARVTGETMEHLTERMAEGKFSFEELRKSMEYATSEGGRFNHMQERMLETPGGQYKEMVTNIEQAKTELGLALLPAEANVMKAFMPMIEALPEELEKMRPSLELIINDFAELVKWTSNNTDTISKWVGWIKTGAEAWVVWKVATTGATVANWAWTTSIGGQEAATMAATTALEAQNVVLGEQIAEVEGLGVAYAGLGAEETIALMAQKNFALTSTLAARGAGMEAGALGASMGVTAGELGAGIAGAATGAIIWVGLAYVAANAVNALFPNKTKEKWNEQVDGLFGHSSWSNSTAGTIAPDASITDKIMQAAKDKAEKLHPHSEDSAGKLSAVADSIIGGGPRQITINAKFMEHAINHFAGGKEGGKQTVDTMKEDFYKMLQSIPTR